MVPLSGVLEQDVVVPVAGDGAHHVLGGAGHGDGDPLRGGLPARLPGAAHTAHGQHAGELLAQLDETFANFDSLLAAARQRQPALPARFGAGGTTSAGAAVGVDFGTVLPSEGGLDAAAAVLAAGANACSFSPSGDHRVTDFPAAPASRSTPTSHRP